MKQSFCRQNTVSQPVQAQPYVKRQQDYISEDIYRCCNPDIQTPFRNLQDALDRLLPYHVFYTDDGGEADKNSCKAEDGTPISQREAAKQETLGKAATLLEQIQKLESQIAAEEAERAAPGRSRAEEEYFLAILVADAERKEIARLQKEAQEEAKRQLEARMHREMENQRAIAQQFAHHAMAAAMAASSAPMPPQAAVPAPASQSIQQPASATITVQQLASTAQPAAAVPALSAAAPAAAERSAIEPKAEIKAEAVKAEPEPAPAGWSGWSGWE